MGIGKGRQRASTLATGKRRRRLRWPNITIDLTQPRGRRKFFFASLVLAIVGAAVLYGGLQAFHWVQGKFHIVLGHYKSYYTYQLEPLAGFALDLLAGVPIQTAYFDVDPDYNTSAIAAEDYPFPGWPASTMVNDEWDDAGPDHEDTSIFTQRWITPVGTVAEHWD